MRQRLWRWFWPGGSLLLLLLIGGGAYRACVPTPQPTWSIVVSPTATPPPAFTPTPTVAATPTAAPSTPTLMVPTPTRAIQQGYGIHVKGVNYQDDSLAKAAALRWEWIKVYDYPPAERLPFKVLYRVNLPRPGEDWAEWGHYRFLDAQLYVGRIDAYEIGNEPNLIQEWGGPPDPAAYAQLLQIAYQQIKAADPHALIVTAGLAPVEMQGNPQYMNDIEFLRQMYAHGAADWFDVLGLHPFGFAYAPEVAPNGEDCSVPPYLDRPMLLSGCRAVNGLCFRRAELARAVMLEYGDADTPVWATEFGWVIRPPSCCRAESDWPERYWQVVTEETQADYIVRAFAYAHRRWPWMQVMFLWNLDFSRYTPPHGETCPPCDSMGWYSILNPDGSPRRAYERLLVE